DVFRRSGQRQPHRHQKRETNTGILERHYILHRNLWGAVLFWEYQAGDQYGFIFADLLPKLLIVLGETHHVGGAKPILKHHRTPRAPFFVAAALDGGKHSTE